MFFASTRCNTGRKHNKSKKFKLFLKLLLLPYTLTRSRIKNVLFDLLALVAKTKLEDLILAIGSSVN